MASPACIKIEGVPVEFNVATIFEAIMALFPIPETMTLPLDSRMQFTASENSSFNKVPKLCMEALSDSIVFLATARIALLSFKL